MMSQHSNHLKLIVESKFDHFEGQASTGLQPSKTLNLGVRLASKQPDFYSSLSNCMQLLN